MILITTEEIAVYVKKEIIRELFTNVKGFNHCGVIDLWISGKTLDRYISKVSQYFLNETKEITNTAKITYKPQSRATLDKAKLTEVLGDDLKPFEKVTTYSVLRIK